MTSLDLETQTQNNNNNEIKIRKYLLVQGGGRERV
jgi:hypothetical protein